MFGWTVGVSLVFMLLLIWSALVRDSLRSKSAQAEPDSAQPDRRAAEPSLERGSEPTAPKPALAYGPPKHTVAEPGAPDTAAGSVERAVQHAAGN